MAFVDEARIQVVAGSGGNGASSFHREPYKPKGGPDGGDGGDGGSVILRADPSVGTLLELRDHPHVRAEKGSHGQGGRRHGAKGSDRVMRVPVGTVVLTDDNQMIADLAATGSEFVAARGGRGGRGNARFATSTRRAPTFSERGEPGEERWLRLELQSLADVGIVGFPNAGKSTLIARVSSAKPKIADYPFTTLEPNLGVVRVDDRSFVMADIPGLVPGAHEGKGLGDRFLRHISRAGVFVILVDLAAVDRDPTQDAAILTSELQSFDSELSKRPMIFVANKIDVARDRLEAAKAEIPDVLGISAVTGEGIERLLYRLADEVEKARPLLELKRRSYVRHVSHPEAIKVAREGDGWRVSGSEAERAVAMANLDNDESVSRLQRKLISIGVERALEDAGASSGDEVRIGEVAFEFEPESGATHA
jgi:GTP-binding protein